jgi:hypothetical protein
MDELVVRVGREMRRLASPGNDHARPVLDPACRRVDRRRQVHQQADRGEDALRKMDESNELSQSRHPA